MPNQDTTLPPQDPLSGPPFRIGIVGGMGPLAGVYLQRLIIEATPARRDQDHFQVVCFTNPQVPERMRSLAEDGGRHYADAIRASARLLVDAGVSHIAVPCNTAHARLAEIQRGVDVPIVNMVKLALQSLVDEHGCERRVGLLATVGTIEQRVYQDGLPGVALDWVLPDEVDQRIVSEAILAVKVNEGARAAAGVLGVTRTLVDRGADVVVVGCTELSMCLDALRSVGVPLVDPMRILARHLVDLGLQLRQEGAARGRD
jgi:aspartate racemase